MPFADRSLEPLVDLVVPVYNEAHVLENSIGRLAAAMPGWSAFRGRILIVDNGSTDATAAVAQSLAAGMANVRFLRLEAKGRGGALRRAWTDTDAHFSLYMDVDLSTDLAAVPATVALLADGADLVTGSRLDREALITRSLKREILSRGYNWLVRQSVGTRKFDDAQCGFKAVRLETVRPLLPLIRNNDWFFDTELLVLAELAELDIRTLPIHWVEDPDSRVRVLPTIWEDVVGLLRLRRTARRLIRDWQAGGADADNRVARVQGH